MNKKAASFPEAFSKAPQGPAFESSTGFEGGLKQLIVSPIQPLEM